MNHLDDRQSIPRPGRPKHVENGLAFLGGVSPELFDERRALAHCGLMACAADNRIGLHSRDVFLLLMGKLVPLMLGNARRNFADLAKVHVDELLRLLFRNMRLAQDAFELG